MIATLIATLLSFAIVGVLFLWIRRCLGSGILCKALQVVFAFGIHNGIELDGGGSATMAAMLGSRVKVISRPSHTNLPARERPVANHLLIKARSRN